MKVAVWDTYVTRDNGQRMHFDILVPSDLKNESTIYNYGEKFLLGKSFKTSQLTSSECQYCHMEQATPTIEEQIAKNGYAIIEMENCN